MTTPTPERTARTSARPLHSPRVDRVQIWSLVGLLLVVALAAGILAWAWSGDPRSNSLRYEVAKTALQVLGVAGLGSLAALATFMFQHSATLAGQRREINRERWRLENDKLRDKRERQDELLRALLRETLTAYNLVKRIRRLLTAETRDESGVGHITRDRLDVHLASLIDQQLEFEKFKRLAPFIDDDRLDPVMDTDDAAHRPARDELQAEYESIESYLNHVIDDYKKQRFLVPDGREGTSLASFPRLRQFMETDNFDTGVAHHIDVIITILQGAVLDALVLPPLDTEGSS
jgi:hypothetical protein